MGSVLLAREALLKLVPAVFIDTSGYAFAYPLARAAGCHVGCYVHYPWVSTDMLARVVARVGTYNNASDVAASSWRTRAKVVYYRLLAAAYGYAGRSSEVWSRMRRGLGWFAGVLGLCAGPFWATWASHPSRPLGQ